MTLELLRELMRHMEWADAQCWSAVNSHPRALDDSDLIDRLFHIHTAQYAFLHVWRGDPFALPDRSSFESPDSIWRWAHAYYPQAYHFVDALDIQTLAASVVMPWADSFMKKVAGKPAIGVPTLAETILQIAAHSTHHRGQVIAGLRQLGAEPPLADFIRWIWSGRPEPEWPAPSATLPPA